MVKKKTKRPLKDYNDLSESTRKRLDNFLDKAYKSGYKFAELREMNDDDFAINLGISKGKKIKNNKWSNIESHRRLLNQVQKTDIRRTETVNRITDKYQTFGFRGKGLDKIKRDLTTISGNLFTVISKEIEKTYYAKIKNKERRERKANNHTKKLMLIPKSERENLNQIDYDIIQDLYP